jgi:hypothetical protein
MFYILEKEVRREFRDQIQEAQDAGDSAKADTLRKERQDEFGTKIKLKSS